MGCSILELIVSFLFRKGTLHAVYTNVNKDFPKIMFQNGTIYVDRGGQKK